VAISLLAAALFPFRSHPSVLSVIMGNPTFRHPASDICQPGGVVAGVIRNDGDGWAVIDDQTHTPINIAFVESDARGIVVGFSFDASDIHTFIVGSDEALSLAGVFSGASVNTDRARISISRDSVIGAVRTSPLWIDSARFPFSNFWIYGLFSAECP